MPYARPQSPSSLAFPKTESSTDTVLRGRRYLSWLRSVLGDQTRYAAVEADVKAQVRAFARENNARLKPTNRDALRSLTRTAVALLVSMISVYLLVANGLAWLGLLFVPVAGAALYGVTSLVHDAVHFSLFPTKRANRLVGRVLAPLVLLDYASFRNSHMGHHRHSQSITKDPKYPKPPRSRGQRDPGDSPSVLARLGRLPLELWYLGAHRVLGLPPRLRAGFYLSSLFALGLPIVVFYGGEVSFRERDWKTASPWLSLVGFAAFCAGLFVASPVVLAFFIASLWVAMGFFFAVFATHLTPYQLYPAGDNPSLRFFSLNISDITFGRTVEYLGHNFTEHHAAHHLLPQVPSYRLAEVGDWVRRSFGPMRAPGFDFTDAHDLNVVGDALMFTVTNARGESLEHWDTAVGRVSRRRVVTAPAS